jgi:hypothetical protein
MTNARHPWSARLALGLLGLVLAIAASVVTIGRRPDAIPATDAADAPEALALALESILQRGHDRRSGIALRPLAPATALADVAALAEGACAALADRLPHSPGLLRLAAGVHLLAGYVRRAREMALAAAQLDALDAEAFEILALTAGIDRRDAEMREFISIARQIGHEGMGRAEVFDAWRRRNWAAVERAHSAWVGWGGKWLADWVPVWVRGLADPAQHGNAARMLDAHDAATRQYFVSDFIEYARLGEHERSLSAVEHHARLPPATWMQHLWWPELAPVRQAPGFIAAMQALGTAALWEARGAPDFCARRGQGQWSCLQPGPPPARHGRCGDSIEPRHDLACT